MNRFSDQFLARQMLETRQRGYSLTRFVQLNSQRYVILFSYFGLLLVACAFLNLWMFFCAVLGLVAGCVLRDIAWAKTIGRTWPFSVKVTDWDKVQRLADDIVAAEVVNGPERSTCQ